MYLQLLLLFVVKGKLSFFTSLQILAPSHT